MLNLLSLFQEHVRIEDSMNDEAPQADRSLLVIDGLQVTGYESWLLGYMLYAFSTTYEL